jgi:hypothetical protein
MISPRTPAQIQSAQNNNGVPNTDVMFGHLPVPPPTANVLAQAVAAGLPPPPGIILNPITGRDWFQDVDDCLAICLEIATTKPLRKILNSRRLQGRLNPYVNMMDRGGIAVVLFHTCFGWDQNYNTPYKSWHSIMKWIDTANPTVDGINMTNFWNDYIVPLLDLIFGWALRPHRNIRSVSSLSYNFKCFGETCKRKGNSGRAADMMWSNEYWADKRIGELDSSHFNGHFLDYALIIDRIIPGFYDSLQYPANSQYVTAQQDLDATAETVIVTVFSQHTAEHIGVRRRKSSKKGLV